jgi:SNF2 family DNA or RNA helicase
VDDVEDLLGRIRALERLGREVIVYPDAEAYIDAQLYRRRSKALMDEIRRDPANHPLRTGLLKVALLPYQLDGIAFAAGTGRAILADDMGLGKTIQGIGTAELLSRQTDIAKVLVICPASLKSQWQAEIGRFSHRSCQLVLGSAKERSEQYKNSAFFTICNYEQVLRDILAIERVEWDLIILDEGQRIKNWEAKTSQTVKALRSRFALVLSGTPLENRLEELFSIVEFIDDRRLGPAFRFFHHYRVTDEKGKVLGYKNLDDLRQRLKPVMLRRTRSQVMQDLPPRSTEIRRIPPTDEQLDLHEGHKRIISTIVNKRYLSEMDLLRLQKALLMCRMVADSTFLVDKQPPGHSSKLAELAELLAQLAAEEDRKIVLFSEWTTMLNLIEPIARRVGLQHVRLDGAVPQKKRMALMQQFQREPQCRLFMATNAGATGLNLQAANTVVNVDLPWNPAVLEQRIARAHRMGQKRPVQIFLLVTESTLEEGLLATLSAKQELFLAALDPDAQATRIDLACGMDELKRRMEILLGARPDAPLDETMKAAVASETESLARREKVALAGGQLLGAAFAFLGEMFPATEAGAENDALAEALKDRLAQCLDRDENGALKMTITLPDETVLDNLARSLARIVGDR